MKKLFVFALITVFGTSAVFAQATRSNRTVQKNKQTYSQRFDQRADRNISQLHEDIRTAINRGVETRRLSQKEAKKFMKEYDKISQQEIKLRSRNGLNNKEERQLIASLSNLRGKIYNETGFNGNRRTAGRW